MLYWYPKIKGLKIPQPKTEIFEIGEELADYHFMETKLKERMPEIKEVAQKIGYPLFLRTDQASHKHNWKKAAFVESEEELESHIRDTLEFNYLADMMGLHPVALVFRQYIPMNNLFTAFYGDMPVNPEIRFFIKDGEVVCWHWYWIEDAIENPSLKNWKELLQEEKKNLSDSWKSSVWQVADIFKNEGYWSVDFCKAKDGRWILIDMALGENSWHPECEYKQ